VSLVVTGATREAVARLARQMDQRARLEKRCVREGFTLPERNRIGGWCVWLDYVLPVGQDVLGLGDPVVRDGRLVYGDRAVCV